MTKHIGAQPSARSLIASLGGDAKNWKLTPAERKAATAPARAARAERYKAEAIAERPELADPENADELARAMDILQRMHMKRMSIAAASARSRAAKARRELADAEAALSELDADDVA
jgi:hypothetical protein